MIIDIIVILKCYLKLFKCYFNSIDHGSVRIRNPCPNTDTLCYNKETRYTTR